MEGLIWFQEMRRHFCVSGLHCVKYLPSRCVNVVKTEGRKHRLARESLDSDEFARVPFNA